MKPRNIATEIDSIVSGIEGIIGPLQAAIATLELAKAKLSKAPDGAETLAVVLAAVKEARALIHQAPRKSDK